MPSEELPQIRSMLAASRIDPAAPYADQRAGMALIGAVVPLAEGVTIEPTDAGGVPAELLVPATPVAPEGSTILLLHSGGYCIGGLDSHRPLGSRLAAASGAPVLVVDYRLAPEHPHPAALEDAAATWRWLRAHGHAADQLAVVGDSAGGGLAVALALHLRDEGEPLPAALACLCPFTDQRGTAASLAANATTDVVLTPELLATWSAAHLSGHPADDPAVSPALGDLTGLPPLLVQASDDEMLLDDARLLAERATAAGVAVTLDVRHGLPHDWHLFAGLLPEGDEDVARVADFLVAHLTDPARGKR